MSLMAQPTDQPIAKRVFLHRNGHPNLPAKTLVINKRQIRDFNSFLGQVTGGINAPVAVRNIYTAKSGTRVSTLDQLQTGKHYVAGGTETFKRGSYKDTQGVLLPQRKSRAAPLAIPARVHQAVVASARYKKLSEKPISLHVYRNGDERFHGAKILISKKTFQDLEKVLELVTEKAELYTPGKRLFTMEGHMVTTVEELQDKGEYVVVEGSKPFKRVAYSRNEVPSLNKSVSPSRRLPKIRRLKPIGEPKVSDAVTREEPAIAAKKPFGRHLRPKPPAGPAPVKVGTKFSKVRPMGGRKNKAAREIALKDSRDDSVFGGSPILTRSIQLMPSPPGSGFPTQGAQATETRAHQPMTSSPTLPEETAVETPPPSPPKPQRQKEVVDEVSDDVTTQLEVSQEIKVEAKLDVTSQEEQREDGDITVEEQIEEDIKPQPSQPALMEFQRETVQQNVDLTAQRKEEDFGTSVSISAEQKPSYQIQGSTENLNQSSQSNLKDTSKSSNSSIQGSKVNLANASKSSIRSVASKDSSMLSSGQKDVTTLEGESERHGSPVHEDQESIQGENTNELPLEVEEDTTQSEGERAKTDETDIDAIHSEQEPNLPDLHNIKEDSLLHDSLDTVQQGDLPTEEVH